MKKNGVLNKDISEVVASMGHTDSLMICDAGLPIPLDARRIDLAVKQGLPGFIEIVEVMANELAVEKIILADKWGREKVFELVSKKATQKY